MTISTSTCVYPSVIPCVRKLTLILQSYHKMSLMYKSFILCFMSQKYANGIILRPMSWDPQGTRGSLVRSEAELCVINLTRKREFPNTILIPYLQKAQSLEDIFILLLIARISHCGDWGEEGYKAFKLVSSSFPRSWNGFNPC